MRLGNFVWHVVMLAVPVLILRGGGADQDVPTIILALRRHRLQNWLNKVGLVLR